MPQDTSSPAYLWAKRREDAAKADKLRQCYLALTTTMIEKAHSALLICDFDAMQVLAKELCIVGNGVKSCAEEYVPQLAWVSHKVRGNNPPE